MKTLLRHIVKKLVVQSVIILCTTFLCFGQIKLPNPSFEDTISCICYDAIPPYNYYCANQWDNCNSSPDPSTYSQENIHPSDGKFYMGIWCSMNPATEESICTKLPCGLVKNMKYSFSMDTRKSKNSPLIGLFEIYGGKQNCKRDELLCVSQPILDTSTWVRQSFSFTPSDNYDYFIITGRPVIDSTIPLYSYILFDNISDITIDSSYSFLQALATTTQSEIINGSCTSLIGNLSGQDDGSFMWYSNNQLIGSSQTIIVCPSLTSTFVMCGKNDCGYWGSDSIVVTVTPNNKAYYNSSTGKLQLEYSLGEKATFKLFNILGQAENETAIDFTQHQTEINLATLTSGIYIACFKNEKGKTIWKQKLFIVK